jgi:hypothetical protein
MRVTNHVPPHKERMARSMLEYRSAGRDNDDFVLPEHSLGSRQQSDLRA